MRLTTLKPTPCPGWLRPCSRRKGSNKCVASLASKPTPLSHTTIAGPCGLAAAFVAELISLRQLK
jgi:hypothetical protein